MDQRQLQISKRDFESYSLGDFRITVFSSRIRLGWIRYGMFVLTLMTFSMLVDCSTKTFYYRPNGNQYQFDIDSKACLGHAEIVAQSKMVNHEAAPDPILVQKYYEGCLIAHGWSRIPLDQRDRSLWKRKGGNLVFKTFALELPSGFSPSTESKWVIGPTWTHQIQAEGPDKETYLVLAAQESMANPFEIIAYPTPEGHVFYTGGRLDRFDVHWSLFTGHYQQNLIAILGAYIHLDKTRRVSLVFSRSLTSTDPAIRGYTLSLSQKKELDQIYPDWLSWIKAQTGGKEAKEKPDFRSIFRFLW